VYDLIGSKAGLGSIFCWSAFFAPRSPSIPIWSRRTKTPSIWVTNRLWNRVINSKDGAPTYVMLYNGAMAPGEVSHADTGGHIHQWQHAVYILEGTGTLVCGGKSYTVSEGDGVLVPGDVQHQWKNETDAPMLRITFNAVASETAEH